MGIADSIRIARGLLTDEEVKERNIAARARRIAAEGGNEETHRARVRKCAGLSAVIFECHLDTWEFALRVMSGPWLLRDKWTKDPAERTGWSGDDESLVRLKLSGARLAELVSVLWYLPASKRKDIYVTPPGMEIGWKTRPAPVDEDKAARLYHAIAPVVDRVEVNTRRQGDLPVVVIDDAITGL